MRNIPPNRGGGHHHNATFGYDVKQNKAV